MPFFPVKNAFEIYIYRYVFKTVQTHTIYYLAYEDMITTKFAIEMKRKFDKTCNVSIKSPSESIRIKDVLEADTRIVKYKKSII